MTILETIIAGKRKEVAALKQNVALNDFEKSRFFTGKTISLAESLSAQARSGIIAEFKRMSPSKGVINAEADPGDVTKGYALAGASGLSVLTDKEFFGGTIDDLMLVRELNTIPVLRKDFIIDELQVFESKAAGADVILLLAAALNRNEVHKLAGLARSLSLEVILEVHNSSELEVINEHINIIGVNNRDLKTFNVNVNVSLELADKIPGQFRRISESGISDPSTVRNLRDAGYDGFLIGELFMASEDPVSAFSAFVEQITRNNAEN